MNDFYFTSYSEDFDFSSFNCGDGDLDQYIKNQVEKDIAFGMCSCIVMMSSKNKEISGYFTLTPRSIGMQKLQSLIKQSNYPSLPFLLVGRLAIDKKYRGNKLSELIFSFILKTLFDISKVVKFVGIEVEAKNTSLIKKVYEPLGFLAISPNSRRLVYLIDYQSLKDNYES